MILLLLYVNPLFEIVCVRACVGWFCYNGKANGLDINLHALFSYSK